METSKYFRSPEMHIAQQSRRERLRIQQQQLNHPHDNNVNQQQLYTNEEENNNIPGDDRIVHLQRLRSYNDNNFSSSSEMVTSSFDNKSCDPQQFNTWKSIGSNETTIVSAGLVGHPNNTHPNSYDASRFEIPNRIGYKHYRDVQLMNSPSVTYDSWASASNEVVSMVPEYYAHQQFENVNAQGLSLSLSTMPPLSKRNQCRVVDEKLAPLGETSGPGPLGPFTGYETILKTSKYLNPAQQLLHEISKDICVKDSSSSNGDGGGGPGLGGCCSSNEKFQEAAGSTSTNDSCRPDYLQKKEKLLYMQDEVCRRYKQYHQQMQMVVSSFESVAGLTSATPYISIALKAISKLFHGLRNAISDHLKSVKKALGEDISASSPTTGTSSSRCDTTSSSMFKLIDNPYRKQHPKPAVAVNSLGLFEPQQHVWRPQRGLPDRAVTILRTWLFDHFLHPYPTDSDKHMLASQTGLTRNQVSNWFINARVRIWKPMVEEIHSLETKANAEAGGGGSNVGKNDKQIAPDDGSCSNDSQQLPQLMNTIPRGIITGKQVEFPGYNNASSSGYPGNHMSSATTQAWNQGEGSIVDFVPYLNGGMDLGGFGGAVSLTLGLRQNGQPPTPQHLYQQQPAANQFIRRHCGDQIVYDFVG